MSNLFFKVILWAVLSFSLRYTLSALYVLSLFCVLQMDLPSSTPQVRVTLQYKRKTPSHLKASSNKNKNPPPTKMLYSINYDTIKKYSSRKRDLLNEIAFIQHSEGPNKKRKLERISTLKAEIDVIENNKEEYIETTKQQCLTCKGYDSRWCICRRIFPSAVLIPFLIYHRRCSTGQIQLPLIPKRVFVDIIYPYVVLNLLELIAEAAFRKDIVDLIPVEYNIDENDWYKEAYYRKRIKEQDQGFKEKKQLLSYYFDSYSLKKLLINNYN